eukprot:m.68217 g.68217  ORF g.68217 m.68217 type:complete len:442 (-) comp13888_c1_seq1:134-1459(-)
MPGTGLPFAVPHQPHGSVHRPAAQTQRIAIPGSDRHAWAVGPSSLGSHGGAGGSSSSLMSSSQRSVTMADASSWRWTHKAAGSNNSLLVNGVYHNGGGSSPRLFSASPMMTSSLSWRQSPRPLSGAQFVQSPIMDMEWHHHHGGSGAAGNNSGSYTHAGIAVPRTRSFSMTSGYVEPAYAADSLDEDDTDMDDQEGAGGIFPMDDGDEYHNHTMHDVARQQPGAPAGGWPAAAASGAVPYSHVPGPQLLDPRALSPPPLKPVIQHQFGFVAPSTSPMQRHVEVPPPLMQEAQQLLGTHAGAGGGAVSSCGGVAGVYVDPRYVTGAHLDDDHRTGNSVRDIHNAMERERRINLRRCFDALRETIPGLHDATKAPSLQILQEATAFIEALKQEDARFQAALAEMRQLNMSLRQRVDLKLGPGGSIRVAGPVRDPPKHESFSGQ